MNEQSRRKYLKYRGTMRGRVADIHSAGWHVGLECAEKILILLAEEIKNLDIGVDCRQKILDLLEG